MSESPSSESAPRPRIDDIAERLRRDAAAGVSGEHSPKSRKKAVVGALVGAALIAAIVGVATRSNGDSAAHGADGSATTAAAANDTSPAPTTDLVTSTTGSVSTTQAPETTAESPTTSAPAATSSPASASSVAPTSSAPTSSAPTTKAPPTTASASNSSVANEGVLSSATTDLVRWAVYQNGKLYLRGRVPDAATQDDLAGKAAAVIGKDNVFVEYTIDPAAPRPDQAPVFVNDTVLFGSGSSTFSGQYNSLLDLGVTLLKLYPSVEIIATGYTDDLGTEDYNLKLSQRRVDAIRAYVIDHGGDAARITGVAKGEANPTASNDTAEGRAANRRIEFTIIGLLDA